MEENKNTESTESKVVVAYVVKRFENGDVNVENAEIEGIEKMSSEALYKDIEDLADMIHYKRVENSAYRGIQRFYMDAARQEQNAAAEAPTAEPTV